MTYDLYETSYMDDFTLMGGIDVQTTLGFGDLDRVRREVGGLIDRFSRGGLILCTTHFVQDHCSVDELELVLDFVYERIRSRSQ